MHPRLPATCILGFLLPDIRRKITVGVGPNRVHGYKHPMVWNKPGSLYPKVLIPLGLHNLCSFKLFCQNERFPFIRRLSREMVRCFEIRKPRISWGVLILPVLPWRNNTPGYLRLLDST
jgi:hypothetical protein